MSRARRLRRTFQQFRNDRDSRGRKHLKGRE